RMPELWRLLARFRRVVTNPPGKRADRAGWVSPAPSYHRRDPIPLAHAVGGAVAAIVRKSRIERREIRIKLADSLRLRFELNLIAENRNRSRDRILRCVR